MPRDTPRLHTAAAIAASLAIYAALFGGTFARMGTELIGYEDVDAYGTQWFYWFVGRALHGVGSIGHTDLFFFPFGKDIYTHTGANVLDAIVAQPFLAMFGPTLGYNLFCLFALLCNGVAARWLMSLFTEHGPSRVVGATLYALSPFLLSELGEGRPTQVFQPFLPLFFYHLLRFEEAGWKHAVAAALHLALTAFTYWFYAIFAGMVAIVHFAQRAVLHPEPRRFLLRHAIAAALSLAFVIPAALPLISSTMGEATPGLLAAPTWPFLELSTLTAEGVKVGIYQFQPLLGANGFFVEESTGGISFYPQAIVLTWAQVLLAALGLALSRHRWVLGAMLLASLALAVGHAVWVMGATVPNPLYVLAVKIIPFMRRLWWPGRAMAVVSLLLGVLAAAGLGELARRRGPRLTMAVSLAGLALFGLELRRAGYGPFPSWPAQIPPGYACLAEGPPGAIIELPYGRSQAHLYYQTAHGRPILGGMVEDNAVFTPARQRALLEENSFLRVLLALANDPTSDEQPLPEDQAAIAALGYRYVVLQHAPYVMSGPASGLIDPRQSGIGNQLRRRLARLLGAAVYTDADLSIYAPWGDPSPCDGTGRLAHDMHQSEARTRDESHKIELRSPDQ